MGLPPIPQDFIAHWPGTISGGQLIEETGNYPATISGTVTRAIGRVGEAAEFDGATGVADATVPGATGDDITVCGFLTSTVAVGGVVFVQKHTGAYADTSRGMIISGNKVAVFARDGGHNWRQATGTTAIQVGSTNFVAFVQRGLTLEAWLNGRLEASYTMSSSYGKQDGFRFGNYPNTSTAPLSGALNRMRVYPRALSLDELKACALERPTIPAANLLAAWSYAGLAEGVVPDTVGSNNLIATGGAPKTGMRVNTGIDYDNPTSAAVPNDYDELGIPVVLSGDFTFSMAVTPDGVKDKIAICGDASPRSILALTASTGVVEIDNGTVYASPGAGALTAGQEYVVEITRSGSTMEFWLDGVSIGTWAAFSGDFTIRYLGVWTTASDALHSTWSHGQPRIYSTVLSASDIALLATERPRVPTLGLVSRWTMDNIDGPTLVDEMGANNGSITGAVQVDGMVGKALSFDNSAGDRVDAQITSGSGKDKFAISMHINPNDLGSAGGNDGRHLFSIGGTASPNRSFAVALKGNFYVVTYGDDRDTGVSVPTGQRSHVLVKQDGGVVEVLVEGQVLWSDTFSNLNYDNSIQRIGAWWGTPEAFHGLIDQVQSYGPYHSLDALDALALANESIHYFISGQVKEDGSPVIRTIRAYRDDDGTLLGSAQSDANGDYRIDLDTGQQVLVMAVGGTGYRPRVHGPIDPTESV